MRLSALSFLFPACALVGSERKTLDGEETIHWHRCQEPSSDKFVIPAVVSSETERNPDGTKLALFQCWEFEYAVPSVPGLETASLIPWGNFAESFQFDIKGAYHQPPHAPPAVSLIVFIAGEGIMTIPGTGQKWRGRGGDILIAADTDGSHEMDWKAGTRVVDFSFSGLNAVPAHKTPSIKLHAPRTGTAHAIYLGVLAIKCRKVSRFLWMDGESVCLFPCAISSPNPVKRGLQVWYDG